MHFTIYSALMALGLVVSLLFWKRLAQRNDELLIIYLCALLGAFVGAKLVYVFAEGWLHFGAPDMWLQLATGKSIVGALLGGYAAVEITKRWIGYAKPTGDWFAQIVPAVIALGRVGCLLHGCCLGEKCAPAWYTLADRDGYARWPAVPVELAFNVIAFIAFALMRKRGVLRNQHFHIYLIAYGLFRVAHEFVRDTPRVLAGFTGYQIASLAVAALGAIGFSARQRQQSRANAAYFPSNSSICTQRLW